MTAETVIELLGLQRHPEGGWFAETYRPATAPGERPPSTAIYYLLRSGEHSHWHRVDAAEAWHYYAGAPLRLLVAGAGRVTAHLLGTDLGAGQRPQAVVPPGGWQAADTTGDWTLVGCTVAPGFEYKGFELAPPGWHPEGP